MTKTPANVQITTVETAVTAIETAANTRKAMERSPEELNRLISEAVSNSNIK